MATSVGGWVDQRIANALDHLVNQVNDPNSPVAKAVETIADKVGDRIDESLGKLDDHVADVISRTRDEVRKTLLNLLPDSANIASQVVDAITGLLPFPFHEVRGAAPPFGPGGPGVRPPKEREPEGE